jgi:glucans biosynthesis protein
VRVNASGLGMTNPRGFGLIQRDRDFANYQDLETREELRPSTWVEPRGDWGAGRVELVEIPSNTELVDNMVAYWVPAAPVQPGQRLDFSYTVSFFTDDAALPPGGRVLATRQDGGAKGDTNRFVLDFGGKELNAMVEKAPEAVISVAPKEAGELLDHQLVRNPDTGGWRLTFQVKAKTDKPVELRAFLKNEKAVLTETWSYAIIK